MTRAGGSFSGDAPQDDGALVNAAQDALLPKGLAILPRIDVAAASVVGANPDRRGGDWFDTLALGGGRMAVIVGDVPGNGLSAVAAMSQLRSVLLASLLRNGDPQSALVELEAYAVRLPDAAASTAVVAVLDPVVGVLTYCTAGHPPPLVLPAADDPHFLMTSGAGPLGRGGQEFPTQASRWGSGDTLLFYSDGLLDDASRPRGNATVALAAAAAGCRAAGDESLVDALARRLPMELTGGRGSTDDMILVAAQRRRQPISELRVELPATGEALLTVRRELDAWTTPLGLSAIDAMSLQHAVGELLANVVQHAYDGGWPRGRVRLRATMTDDAVLEVEVGDDGAWRSSETRELLSDQGGRGLNLARLLTDELLLDLGSDGTRVLVRFEPQKPVSMYAAPTRVPPRRDRSLAAEVRQGALALSGALDLSVADDLRQLLGRASLGATRDADVDLSDVDMLDSTAVQVLLDAQQASAGNGRTLGIVAAIGSPAQQVLELVRLPYRPRDETEGDFPT
jgi:anti-sigma regulatory factor (Ser/Thr protein kinase)/anti-anti-sigma regulatory factor